MLGKKILLTENFTSEVSGRAFTSLGDTTFTWRYYFLISQNCPVKCKRNRAKRLPDIFSQLKECSSHKNDKEYLGRVNKITVRLYPYRHYFFEDLLHPNRRIVWLTAEYNLSSYSCRMAILFQPKRFITDRRALLNDDVAGTLVNSRGYFNSFWSSTLLAA